MQRPGFIQVEKIEQKTVAMQAVLNKITTRLGQVRFEAVKDVICGDGDTLSSALANLAKDAIEELSSFVQGETMVWLKAGQMPQDAGRQEEQKEMAVPPSQVISQNDQGNLASAFHIPQKVKESDVKAISNPEIPFEIKEKVFEVKLRDSEMLDPNFTTPHNFMLPTCYMHLKKDSACLSAFAVSDKL